MTISHSIQPKWTPHPSRATGGAARRDSALPSSAENKWMPDLGRATQTTKGRPAPLLPWELLWCQPQSACLHCSGNKMSAIIRDTPGALSIPKHCRKTYVLPMSQHIFLIPWKIPRSREPRSWLRWCPSQITKESHLKRHRLLICRAQLIKDNVV